MRTEKSKIKATDEARHSEEELIAAAASLRNDDPTLFDFNDRKIAKTCGLSLGNLRLRSAAIIEEHGGDLPSPAVDPLAVFEIDPTDRPTVPDMSDVKIGGKGLPDIAMQTPTLPGYSFSEAVQRKLKVTPYIVKNVINEGEVGFLFGDSGTMKSFVAADMVYHAAIGKQWNGFRVKPEGTGVLIVLAEGQAGYQKRIQALHKKHGIDAPIWIVPEPVDAVREPEKLKAWVDMAEAKLGRQIGLVLMDTFSLMMGDGNESDNTDVGKTLNAVRAALGSRAVLFIHHTGHGDKQRERGAYQIRANADKRILVCRDEGGKGRVITVEGLKAKDDLEFPAFNVTYEVIVLGVDQDGDDITSLVIVPTDMEAVASEPSGRSNTRAVECVIEAIKLAGTNSKELVRPHFYSLYTTGTQATKRNQFRMGWNAYMNSACKSADQAKVDEGL